MSTQLMRRVAAWSLIFISMAASASDKPGKPDERGRAVYERCLACHAVEQHRTGPAHCGLFGRKAGTAPGFADYSDAMKRSGWVWSPATLNAFLKAPMQALPGTSMGYDGVKDDGERAALIAWLRTATRPGADCKMPK